MQSGLRRAKRPGECFHFAWFPGLSARLLGKVGGYRWDSQTQEDSFMCPYSIIGMLLALLQVFSNLFGAGS